MLKIKCARAALLALIFAPKEASHAVTVVPMFSPRTIAAAISKLIQPFIATIIVMPIAADDDCTKIVRKTPMIRKIMTEPNP